MTTSLKFILKTNPQQRIDVTPLTPDRLQGLSREEISTLSLHVGSRMETVGDLFEIQGEDPQHIRFENPQGKLDHVGKDMRQGLIEVEGDAGSYLGLGMRGGRIKVSGSVDAYAAAELKEGHILIAGNAGDFLGAALPGNRKGMRGGLVRVQGDVGDRAGDHMRRGVLLIEGGAGCYLGSRMTAGTIVALGSVGSGLGYAMNRGTLLLKHQPASMLPTFSDCGTHTLGFLPLLFKSLSLEGEPFSRLEPVFRRVQRYAGDVSATGRGEILVAAAR